MDSSKTTEDDTIKDQAESGYVSTRPRFTRSRDTWKINVRNLAAEDKRALDYFAKVTAARGANAFLFPNLLPNGSFEFGACSDMEIVRGWSRPDGNPQFTIVASAPGYDSASAITMQTIAGQMVTGHEQVTGQLQCDTAIPCAPGDVYVFSGRVSQTMGGGEPSLLGRIESSGVQITFLDADGAALSTTSDAPDSIRSAWTEYRLQFTAPAGAAAFTVTLLYQATSTSSSPFVLDGTQSATWDGVGVALLTPVQLYGRMAGSDALPRPVRFTKLPEFSDIGFGAGVKRYGVNLELTEV